MVFEEFIETFGFKEYSWGDITWIALTIGSVLALLYFFVIAIIFKLWPWNEKEEKPKTENEELTETEEERMVRLKAEEEAKLKAIEDAKLAQAADTVSIATVIPDASQGEVLETDTIPDITDITTEIPGYTFYQGKDSSLNDIGYYPGTRNNMLETCNRLPNCAAFNTNGWLKHIVKAESEWDTWTQDPDKGIFIKAGTIFQPPTISEPPIVSEPPVPADSFKVINDKKGLYENYKKVPIYSSKNELFTIGYEAGNPFEGYTRDGRITAGNPFEGYTKDGRILAGNPFEGYEQYEKKKIVAGNPFEGYTKKGITAGNPFEGFKKVPIDGSKNEYFSVRDWENKMRHFVGLLPRYRTYTARTRY